MNLHASIGYKMIRQWLSEKGFSPFAFQEETWEAIANGESGLVNAPTGFGKTFSVFLGALINFINDNPKDYAKQSKNGLQLLWVTPLRALAKDIGRAMEEVLAETGIQWQVGIRNGDTPVAERQRQKRHMPEVLIITPESLHLLLAQKGYKENLQTLRIIAVDEWHELLGSKRGVQVELAISHIVPLLTNKRFSLFAISATIGNLLQAKEVLLAPIGTEGRIITAKVHKPMEVKSIFPDEIEKYPWSGHLGLKLVDKIIPIIRQSTTTLVFINTRGMTERWYQAILQAAPELAGAIALHHGSIEQDLRVWVEEALHSAKLKAVVCTASLDLGVDFRPVETVIQVGSPKGVARFLQRAGRSGHQPGATSRIYFLPTHSLELVEAAALQQAIDEGIIESREPMLLCFDVLVQWLCTLAVSDGFTATELLQEIKSTYCFREMSMEEWQQIVQFVTSGGKALQQYDDFRKVDLQDGIYRITGRRMAMRHRMHIGTIVSDAMLKVKFISGGYIGVIEEYFISRLLPGDVFTLAGKNLELVMIKDMTVLVRKSSAKKSIVPSWNGGRMPLSANLGHLLRQQFNDAGNPLPGRPELVLLKPLFDLQAAISHVPRANELLIEQIETKDGFHLFVYPFEGRLVHEAMAAILAYRISKIRPITFSFAMNDYGFELLSDQPIPVDDSNVYELFSTDNLFTDIQRSVNSTEMARRKFRDISVIGGLVFQGYPGEHKKARHLQSSASLLFNVFQQYDPDNLLMRQAFQEVFAQQMEETRLRDMLERIQQSHIVLMFPDQLTPFCFPVKVDSMRENLSSEQLEDRIKKMQLQLSK
ncbi:ligase-associated DNA damage response DEXH box helicase [Flavihumibacter profundi]|uniref:ligase-associated DNA damage response DEXH box helicase n=1 Tax=Flavihumibacter profundi TaxID=2716883 RepID=UPI001CC557A6|nr:ligase-associated DNA damage response DEXH box helicase [Flavihumibacter profundi]MBZ5859193.1 ligase-associated DNA damage response DEXH box helicase [Flavihumibacter profundi]